MIEYTNYFFCRNFDIYGAFITVATAGKHY